MPRSQAQLVAQRASHSCPHRSQNSTHAFSDLRKSFIDLTSYRLRSMYRTFSIYARAPGSRLHGTSKAWRRRPGPNHHHRREGVGDWYEPDPAKSEVARDRRWIGASRWRVRRLSDHGRSGREGLSRARKNRLCGGPEPADGSSTLAAPGGVRGGREAAACRHHIQHSSARRVLESAAGYRSARSDSASAQPASMRNAPNARKLRS